MNILLDFLTVQWSNGGGEYCRRVYSELLAHKKCGLKLFALHDSRSEIAYDELKPGKCPDITYLDIRSATLPELVSRHSIDRFFIGMTQVLCLYKDTCLAEVPCEVICVTHDLFDNECTSNQLDYYFKFIRPKYLNTDWRTSIKLARYVLRMRNRTANSSMAQLMDAWRGRESVRLIAVSDYSRTSLEYNFHLPHNRISVLYPPERVYRPEGHPGNNALAEIISSGTPYYLMVNANRVSKNPYKAAKAFSKFASQSEYSPLLVAVGYDGPGLDHVVALPFLGEADLQLAYRHCHALLYPSFFEGFGYPPLEAMHYGKPVLCSHSASMPGIFGDAPIYFNPLYETAIYEALLKFEQADYTLLCQRSEQQYNIIHNRQENDLQQLLSLIAD